MVKNMTLEEIRKEIDSIDPEIRNLLMKRLDCSRQVAAAKIASGDITIYRPDREKALLDRLGEGVPEDRKAGYLAVVRKIMETSRMYQYGLLFEADPALFTQLTEGVAMVRDANRVRLQLTRPDRPNAMSSILSMIGDYGYNMEKMEMIGMDPKTGTVSFELTVRGSLEEAPMQKLMFQLSMESENFRILDTYRE